MERAPGRSCAAWGLPNPLRSDLGDGLPPIRTGSRPTDFMLQPAPLYVLCDVDGRLREGSSRPPRCESYPVVRPLTDSWFSACMIRCSSCQRSACDSPASTFSSSALRGLELRAGSLVVDLLHVHGVVHERERAIELDLEEAGPGRELEHLVRVEMNARRPGLQRRDERRVTRENTDLARCPGDDDHLRLAVERRPSGVTSETSNLGCDPATTPRRPRRRRAPSRPHPRSCRPCRRPTRAARRARRR